MGAHGLFRRIGVALLQRFINPHVGIVCQFTLLAHLHGGIQGRDQPAREAVGNDFQKTVRDAVDKIAVKINVRLGKFPYFRIVQQGALPLQYALKFAQMLVRHMPGRMTRHRRFKKLPQIVHLPPAVMRAGVNFHGGAHFAQQGVEREPTDPRAHAGRHLYKAHARQG